MRTSLAIAMLAASALLPPCTAPLGAQAASAVPPPPLLVLALNDLSFGTVLPGVPATVRVNDAQHAGLFEIRGPAGASVRIELVMPAFLSNDAGSVVPLSFGPGDGFVSFGRGDRPRGLFFDPHLPVIGALGPDGHLFVRIGGTALPGRPQAGGNYFGTIFMTVFDLGS
jgi:hypothetical protein